MTARLVVAVALTASGLAGPGGPAAGAQEDGRRPGLATPVLSPRRVPGLLSRMVAQARLAAQLDAALDDPALGRARESSCLTVEEGDVALFERRPGQALVPASTLKVLTGMAALRRMGRDFRFVTEVRAARGVRDGVVDGPLWLVGAGDPLLATQGYAESFRNQPQVYTRLDSLADALVAAGVRRVRGPVVGDESRFDQVRYLASWKPVYVTDHEIGPVSALVVNDNFAEYRPSRPVPARTPATHGAALLTALLRDRGVEVADPTEGFVPREARPVASISSPPLAEVVGQMLRESDNMTAEVLTKELGARFGAAGSWPEGVAVIRATLAGAGLEAEGYQAVDGSGLDVGDRLTCSVLMDALDLAGTDGPVAAGLAVAGRSGTLATRFRGSAAEGRLMAKTGSLNFVAGLVGFVDPGRPPPLEFALLANDLPDRTAAGRALQERVGDALARYPQAPQRDALAPLAPR